MPGAALSRGALTLDVGAPLENVSVVYGPDGARLGLAKKAFPTADERPFLAAAPLESAAVVVDTAAGRLGVVICADAWFPQIYGRLSEAGAKLLAVPTDHSANDI